MVQARRRVSYIIPSPSPSDTVPRLQLPPLGVSRLGVPGPLLAPYPSSGSHTREGGYHRHGRASDAEDADDLESLQQQTPRHRLGVACLALDTSTQLVGKNAPEGILYTGGRDGLVMSWDLGIPMKKRNVDSSSAQDTDDEEPMPSPTATHRKRRGRRRSGRWEVLTGWEDGESSLDSDGEDGGEERQHHHYQVGSDGDVLGDVVSGADMRRRRMGGGYGAGDVPYERRWETDLGAFQPGTRTRFRQCSQAHTDWVNDILLCNYNQTVVSASSDGTVKAWNPHSSTPTDPVKIGMHADYVRCLAYCREQRWVASGSFDRTIKLWDLSRSSPSSSSSSGSPSSPSTSSSTPLNPVPLITLNPPSSSSGPSNTTTTTTALSASAPKSSIYALAADPFGRTIASGGPERVVRLWDPRTGKRTAKLVGHTDLIRAVVVSEDGRYLLTGSADASIKLWSLASQKCLHTFTHHTDSVWSLFSAHPSLEIFYSGDKSGLVCRVDVEGVGGGGGAKSNSDWGGGFGLGGEGDIGEGECVVLCNDSQELTDGQPRGGTATGRGGQGVNKIVVMDDNLLWTASGTSSVRRWHIPQRRSVRMASLSLPPATATATPTSAPAPAPADAPDGVSVSVDGERLSPNSIEFRRRAPGPAPAPAATTPPESRPPTDHGHGHGHSQSITYSYTYSHASHTLSQSHSRRMSASPSLRSFASDVRLDVPQQQQQQQQQQQPGNEQDASVLHGNGGVAGIPYESLVRLVSPNSPFAFGTSFAPSASYYGGYGAGYGATGYGGAYGASGYGGYGGGYGSYKGRGDGDPEVATLYSAASVMSVPRHATTANAGAGAAGPGRPAVQAIFPPPPPRSGSPLGSPGTGAGMLNNSRTEDTIMLSVSSQPSNPRSLYPNPSHPPDIQPPFQQLPDLASDATPLLHVPDFVIPGSAGLVRSVILNDRMHALTVDTSGTVGVWDIVRGRCVGVVGVEDVRRAVGGEGAGSEGSTGAGAGEDEDEDGPIVVVGDGGDDGEPGTPLGTGMDLGVESQRSSTSPREALEAVRERIEGEGVVATWCYADTKGGVLTIHLTERCFEAEVYADEVGFEGDGRFNDESKLNIGKWVLRNLFIGFIQQELRLHQSAHGHGHHTQSPHTQQQQKQQPRSISRTPSRDTLDQNVAHSRFPTITPDTVSSNANASTSPAGADPTRVRTQALQSSPNSPGSTTILSSPSMIPAVAPTISNPVRSSPLLAPLIPLHVLSKDSVSVLPSIPSPGIAPGVTSADVTPTPGAAGLSLPLYQRTRSGTIDGSMVTTPLVTSGLVTPGVAGKEDYFSLRTRQPSVSLAAGGILGTPLDDFLSWGGPNKSDKDKSDQTPLLTPPPQTPSTPSGLMSRLKSFGKITKRPVSDVPNVSTLTTPAAETPTRQADVQEVVYTPVQKVLQSETLSPPSSMEAPLHALPPNTTVLISEEAQPGYNVLYRRDVERVHEDVQALEEAMPLWLAEYLFLNRIPSVVPLAKLSFVLMPWNKDPDVEPLPELLNTQQSKLTASRYLRVKKIVNHVQDKLERMALATGTRSGTNSIRSSVDSQDPNQHHDHTRPRAEDEYEILCNDIVLPLGMSLAAVRQYVWRQGAELVMHYRKKRASRPHVFN